MSGATTQDMGFLKWKDPWAWTENPTEFKRTALEETSRLKREVAHLSNATERAALAQEFADAAEEDSRLLLWYYPRLNPVIVYRPITDGGGGYRWSWMRGTGAVSWKEAGSVDCWVREGQRPIVVYTAETLKGRQSYQLMARTPGRIAWKYGPRGSEDCAILGDAVFFIEEESPLRFTRLVAVDLNTGELRGILYQERDPEWTIRLVRGDNQCLFLLRERAGESQCFHIESKWGAGYTLERIWSDATLTYPIGSIVRGGTPVGLVKLGDVHSPWLFRGVRSLLPPAIGYHGIEYTAISDGILVSRCEGVRTIWKFRPGFERTTSPRELRDILGAVISDPISNWRCQDDASIWFVSPGATIQCLRVEGNSIECPVIPKRYAKVYHGSVISEGGAAVHWALASTGPKPKGLVVTAYGAYGQPTALSTARWRPWIEAGWAVGFAMVRGGGDDGEAWAAAGRLEGKEAAIGDLEAIILHLQILTGCGQDRTCVYGRSAGGLLVGGIAGRHSAGGLARMLYTEVPYVDMLKTSADASLPLTPGEYHEFGNPRLGPAEFQAVLRSSPVHRLGPTGAEGIRVVCRTGMRDINVYPYESLKWILALRGQRRGADGKFLGVNAESHYTHGAQKYKELAEDFFLITRGFKDGN